MRTAFVLLWINLVVVVAMRGKGSSDTIESTDNDTGHSMVDDMIDKLDNMANEQTKNFDRILERLFGRGIGRIVNSKSALGLQAAFSKPVRRSKGKDKIRSGLKTELLFRELRRLIRRNDLTSPVSITNALQSRNEETCPYKNVDCTDNRNFKIDVMRYRTPDGQCNNLKNSSFGRAEFPFIRYLPADYGDGLSTGRLANDGGQLPNPRLISREIHTDFNSVSGRITHMVMQWGQFLDHDITRTPMSSGFEGTSIDCCAAVGEFPNGICDMAINVPANDLSFTKQSCINFVRSAPTTDAACTLGARQQLNEITSFIDGSNVYGSTYEEQVKLREMANGVMKQTDSKEGSVGVLLPQDHDDESCATDDANKRPCFAAGDIRVNEQPGLASIHTIWLREHNRIVTSLRAMHSAWPDEIIFQESRKIVGALLQHITYNEWLPIILGQTVMVQNGLTPLTSGYFRGYDEAIDPTIANVFATATFRFGHSLIDDHLVRLADIANTSASNFTNLQLKDTFFNPKSVYDFDNGGCESILKGLASQGAQTVDRFIKGQLTNELFTDGHMSLDLAALNIQRGRDHGLPGYNLWREYCNLPRATAIDELAEIPPGIRTKLESIYAHVDDIDIFTGGLAETRLPDALVGPTFACILAKQFHALKVGDRFWYENDLNDSKYTKFTTEQLTEIRKVTLSGILCQNMVASGMPQNSFLKLSTTNPFIDCDDIPTMDLSKWTADLQGMSNLKNVKPGQGRG
ncbi:unnamed protein product [Owenia fusiformis]|uniref:Uncharacterized protein n=3 Tax=Owenia fusiformis TaxID=6347 RepID=A0A8J1UH32_OWEFU|nr:unnamed protein product [Owenia fusiformis]